MSDIEPSREEIIEFLKESNAIEREYSEVALQDALCAWDYAYDYRKRINLEYILDVHYWLMKRLNPDIAGKLRECDVFIGRRRCVFVSLPLLEEELNSWLISTNSWEKPTEGDEVFFIGLFTPYYGSKKNYPITRFGRVALITDEKIPLKPKKRGEKEEPPIMTNLYLVESQSFGGNSGSPVFFYLGLTREPFSLKIEGAKILLAGVMKGSFLDKKEIQVIETKKTPISLDNVGIAAVIPAYKLYEILFSDELKKIRAGVSSKTP